MELRWDNELQQDYFDFTNGRCEVPLGVIRSEDLVEAVELNGQTWIHFTCVLWAKYCYRQVKRLLKDQRKKISVEVEVLESHTDENGIEIIDKFTFDGFSLLGEDVIEAIPNAHLTILDRVNDAFYQKQEKCLTFAYQGLGNENYDFVLTESDIKNNTDSFADDSSEIVENEKTDEIAMERGEEESQKMTYTEMFELLDKAVGEDNWVVDFDDSDVYFSNEDRVTYKAPYFVSEDADGHAIVTISMEEKVPVVRSWKEFAEEASKEEDTSKEEESEIVESKEEGEDKFVEETEEKCSVDNEETESCEEEKEELTDCEEECLSENENGECEICEAEDSCGNCENESIATECNLTIAPESDSAVEVEETVVEEDLEAEPVEVCDDCAEEETLSSDEADDCDCNEDVENVENVENECNMSVEEAEEIEEANEVEEKALEESISVTVEDAHNDGEPEEGIVIEEASAESIKTYAVNEENLTADELYERFTTLSVELNSLREKYEILNAQLTEKKNNEFYAFACSLIDAEEDLSEENNGSIKATFAENCKNSLYTTTEEVQTAVDHCLADALYAQKKMNRNKKNVEFSVNINKSQIIVNEEETLTEAQVLKNLNQKLRRI